jgi:hypothetical protein
LRSDGVSREVRHAGAGAEDDDTALLEVADRATRHVRLRHLTHRDCRLHAGADAELLEKVLQGKAVHDGAEHAHVVGARTVHASHLQLGAPEEVAASDDDCNLHPATHHVGNLTGQQVDDVRVDPELAAAEDLTGELEQHA